MKTEKEMRVFLGTNYPCLLILYMKKKGLKQELEKYMLECRDLQGTDKYSQYVHGFFLPWLQQERE